VVLLQCEVPARINALVAEECRRTGAECHLDLGGEEREIEEKTLWNVDVVSCNESELKRVTTTPEGSGDDTRLRAEQLLERGARRVLVTLGAEGARLYRRKADGSTEELVAPAEELTGPLVDETAAGDAFRAAFAVARSFARKQQQILKEAGGTEETKTAAEEDPDKIGMEYGCVAGMLACTKAGAGCSLPDRDAVVPLVLQRRDRARQSLPKRPEDAALANAKAAADLPRGGALSDNVETFHFASRINSMKDRRDLLDPSRPAEAPNDIFGWIARQGRIKGLTHVDLNYPQHFGSLGPDEISQLSAALDAAGLRCGAVCLRYPSKFQAGAMTHWDPALRTKATRLTIDAGAAARALGAQELVVWSAFCGYDYSLQVDHHAQWDRLVVAFREVCDAHPDLRVSLEYKPTDENTRFFAVPSAGAALLLCQEVDRENFGLTLDLGHCLAAGENPAQSVAMAGRAKKLWGVQLNDGYQRIGAEDGLMFGSVHPAMALEVMLWLRKTKFDGHFYFDTFPRNEDPVRECEHNIRRVKALWKMAAGLETAFEKKWETHDALGVLEIMEKLERVGTNNVDYEKLLSEMDQ